jgi:hypothetical protein
MRNQRCRTQTIKTLEQEEKKQERLEEKAYLPGMR